MQKTNKSCFPRSEEFKIQMPRFNFSSNPISIDQLPQDFHIRSIQVSDDGQGGVIMIELQQGSFVLKPACYTPADLFFNNLAKMMSIKTPKMKYFSHEDPIFFKLKTAINQFCLAINEECLLARLDSKLNSFFFQIFEYIPSVSLADLGTIRFQKIAEHEGKLFQMGKCLGFDILINNNDRFALVWGGDGNISNFLIKVPHFSDYSLQILRDRSDQTVQLGDFVFIDNLGNMCDVQIPQVAQNIARYFKKIQKFHRDMLEFMENTQITTSQIQEEYEDDIKKKIDSFLTSPEIVKFKNQVEMYTGYALNAKDIRQVMQGIKFSTQTFLSLFQNKKIEELYIQISSKVQKQNVVFGCTHEQWEIQLKLVNISFANKMYEQLSKIYQTK